MFWLFSQQLFVCVTVCALRRIVQGPVSTAKNIVANIMSQATQHQDTSRVSFLPYKINVLAGTISVPALIHSAPLLIYNSHYNKMILYLSAQIEGPSMPCRRDPVIDRSHLFQRQLFWTF